MLKKVMQTRRRTLRRKPIRTGTTMSDSNGGGIKREFLQSTTDKNPSHILPEKLSLDSPLQFECHPGVSCFTACCHNIQIVLTPY